MRLNEPSAFFVCAVVRGAYGGVAGGREWRLRLWSAYSTAFSASGPAVRSVK